MIEEPKQLSRNKLSYRDHLVVSFKRIYHPDDVRMIELLLDLALGPQGLDVLVAVSDFWDEFESNNFSSLFIFASEDSPKTSLPNHIHNCVLVHFSYARS